MKDKLQGSMIALHGPPKVGKTQLVSKFPGPVCWLATEYGHRYVPDDQQKTLVQLDPENGWDTIKQWITSSPRGFKTFAVDTISGLYDLCMRWTSKKNGWDHPSDASHGKGWNAVKREFYDVLSRIVHISASNKATLVLIDHSKIESIETTTENVEKVSFAMPGQARSVVLPVPDHMWFLGYAEEDAKDALRNVTSKRALFVGGTNKIEAGCRDPKVKTKIIMPLSRNDPYNQIVESLYGGKKENE